MAKELNLGQLHRVVRTGLKPQISKWAIPFNIRTPPVEEQWNSSGVRDKSGGILQG